MTRQFPQQRTRRGQQQPQSVVMNLSYDVETESLVQEGIIIQYSHYKTTAHVFTSSRSLEK